MVTNVFAVYDDKAGAFMSPFVLPAIGLAVREFQSAVNNPQSNISKYPADFKLYKLGTFDDNSGQFESLGVPMLLGVGTEYVNGIPEEKKNPLVRSVS